MKCTVDDKYIPTINLLVLDDTWCSLNIVCFFSKILKYIPDSCLVSSEFTYNHLNNTQHTFSSARLPHTVQKPIRTGFVLNNRETFDINCVFKRLQHLHKCSRRREPSISINSIGISLGISVCARKLHAGPQEGRSVTGRSNRVQKKTQHFKTIIDI